MKLFGTFFLEWKEIEYKHWMKKNHSTLLFFKFWSIKNLFELQKLSWQSRALQQNGSQDIVGMPWAKIHFAQPA